MKIKIILVASLFMALMACSHKKENDSKAKPLNSNEVVLSDAQFKIAALTTTQISNNAIATILKVNGKIDVPPQNLVSVSAPLGGYLKSTKLLPGMHVNKGEVIAVLEDQQFIQLQQDYLITKSKLYFSEKEFSRQKELNLNQASSDKVTQQAQSEFNNYRILLRALSEKLKLIHIDPETLNEKKLSKSINIYSAISGFVSKVNVNIGKYVTPSDVLFELINPTDIHLNIKVFEKDVVKLAIGQRLLAYSNAQPDAKYPCEIILISKDISADGTSEVHCHFENYDSNLLPGMYMNAEIELKSNRSNTIPDESIVNYDGKDYIFVQQNKYKYQLQEVKLGISENGNTVILNPKDLFNKTIVNKGAYTLLMKMKNIEE